jgi:hypothetical protein
MDHMKILKRAWQIVKKYRAIWWIGLLLVVAGGGLGAGAKGSAPSGSSSGWRTEAPENWEEPFRDLPNMPDWSRVWERIAPVVAAMVVVVAVLALLAIVLSLALTVLRFVTRVSLIQMVNGYEETGEEIGFQAGLRMGWSRSALRLFLLDLMLSLPVTLAMLLLLAPLGFLAFVAFAAGDPKIVLGVIVILAAVPVILLGVLVGIVLGPIRELAYRAIVLQDLGPWAAFKTTVALVRRHLGPAALQWLILIGLRIAWGIVLVPVNLLLVLAAFLVGGLPGLLVGGIAAYAASWPLGLILGGLVFLPIFVVVISIPSAALSTFATVYHSTVWTLTYRELLVLDDGGGSESTAVEPELLEASEFELEEFKADDQD